MAVALALSGCGEQPSAESTTLESEPTLVDAASSEDSADEQAPSQATTSTGSAQASATEQSGSLPAAQLVAQAEPAAEPAASDAVTTVPAEQPAAEPSASGESDVGEVAAEPAAAEEPAPVGDVPSVVEVIAPAPSTEAPAIPASSDEGANTSPTCPTWYADCDGDGYAPASAATVTSCEKPAATADCADWTDRAPAEGATDCEDASAAHHPGADYGLAVSNLRAGLASLFCRPDGTYGPKSSRRCVVTTNPDLNCDGKLEAASEGATFCISGGHCIASLTHECSGADDCSCWSDPVPPCGVQAGVAPNLCPGGSPFTGETALLCR